jgi:hypothetical protein
MGQLIELSYRYFPRLIIEKLIRNGYLRYSDHHRPEAVKRAFDRFREHAAGLVEDANQPRPSA